MRIMSYILDYSHAEASSPYIDGTPGSTFVGSVKDLTAANLTRREKKNIFSPDPPQNMRRAMVGSIKNCRTKTGYST